MKRVTITLPDEQAAALDRAVANGGFASPSEFVAAAIEDFLTAPVEYEQDALARDIAEHQAAKARGEVGYTADEAREWLLSARSR